MWWGFIVVAFYARFGNLPWYILPMYVPASLLIGLHIDRSISGSSRSLVLLGSGVALSVLFSYRFPWDSLFPGPVFLPGEPTSGFIYLVGFVILFSVVGFFSRTAETPSDVLVAGVVLLFVFSAVAPASSLNVGGYDLTQEKLGTAASKAPEGTVIYLHSNVTNRTPFYTFAFYAEHRLSQVSPKRISEDESIRYAVVTRPVRQQLPRRHELLATGTNRADMKVYLVRFKGNSGKQSQIAKTGDRLRVGAPRDVGHV